MLSHIAFTKHWISIPRLSSLNSFGFASLPEAGKLAWNCKTRASFGIVLQYRPRCFSPEVLKKQYCKKNYQTQFKCSVNNSGLLQKHNLQYWHKQSVPYLAYENVAWYTERSFRPFLIAATFLSLFFIWLVLMFLQTSWVNLNICRLLAIHNS